MSPEPLALLAQSLPDGGCSARHGLPYAATVGVGTNQQTLTLETADWVMIDGTMDNAVSNAIDAHDTKTRKRAERVREEGWRQIPDWPKELEGLQSWPAPGQTCTVTLNQELWQFIAAALDESAVTSDYLASLPHFAASREEWLAVAADSRRLAAEVRTKLEA